MLKILPVTPPSSASCLTVFWLPATEIEAGGTNANIQISTSQKPDDSENISNVNLFVYYNLLRTPKYLFVFENIYIFFSNIGQKTFLTKVFETVSLYRHTILMAWTLFSFAGIFQVFWKETGLYI